MTGDEMAVIESYDLESRWYGRKPSLHPIEMIVLAALLLASLVAVILAIVVLSKFHEPGEFLVAQCFHHYY